MGRDFEDRCGRWFGDHQVSGFAVHDVSALRPAHQLHPDESVRSITIIARRAFCTRDVKLEHYCRCAVEMCRAHQADDVHMLTNREGRVRVMRFVRGGQIRGVSDFFFLRK